MTKNTLTKLRLPLLCLAVILLLSVILLIRFRPFGRRPFNSLDGSDIREATLARRPPDDSLTTTEQLLLEDLADILKDLVIYREDNSAAEYSGQLAEISFSLTDGSTHTVGAYNPFLYVDGVSYRTKYEPCEKLNRFVNQVMDENSSADDIMDGNSPTDDVTDGNSPTDDVTDGNSATDDIFMEAKIIRQNDASLLVAKSGPDAGANDLFTFGLTDVPILLADGSDGTPADLNTDMTIRIAFNGCIEESYPAQIGADSIQVIGEEASLVDFYFSVLKEWYEEDPGLNSGITMIGFDLSGLQNLTETEKNSLIYLAAVEYQMEPVTGTYEELCDAGYIDRDNLYWEDGILFELKDEPVEEGLLGKKSFTFSVSKWRSGLGAIGSSDCKASLTKDGWEYEAGAVWIS